MGARGTNFRSAAGLLNKGVPHSLLRAASRTRHDHRIPVLKDNTCKAKKDKGAACTTQRQCLSDRCSAGFCAEAHECQSNAGCAKGEYCGDPIAGRRTCKALKAQGQGCTSDSQCATDRCAWGFCAEKDECRSNSDCTSSQYCGDPISGKSKCKALNSKGDACTKDVQCRSRKCSLFRCK